MYYNKCLNICSGKRSDPRSLLNPSIYNFSGLKDIKRGYIEMTKKIYLETFKKCPGLLCFPLLKHFLDFWFEDDYLVSARTFAIFSAVHISSALSTLSATTMSQKNCFHEYFSGKDFLHF